jgi:hypothetical protein
LQVHKVLVHELVRIYIEYIFASSQTLHIACNNTPLKPGMTVSNGEDVHPLVKSGAHNKTEPGYYADGEYGIRIESVVVVREAHTPNNFGNKGFLGFERVTMVCPVCLSCCGRADPPSRRSLWGETSSTRLFSPWTNVRGWMRIIKRYGRKYPHCSRATQGLKSGYTVSVPHYDDEVGFVYRNS